MCCANAVAQGDEVAAEIEWTGVLRTGFGQLEARGDPARRFGDVLHVSRGEDRLGAKLRLLLPVLTAPLLPRDDRAPFLVGPRVTRLPLTTDSGRSATTS